MDKLRAIQYFVRTVEAGSFGAAARALDVSTPAVTQLVAALERSLGVLLLHRSSRGVALSAAGLRYYEVAQAAAGELHEVELELGVGEPGSKPRGTLTVAMRSGIGQSCVMPQIGRFLARYPDVELILQSAESLAELSALEVDLAVMTGWPPTRDLVVRVLAETRNVVCASPDYWRRYGEPADPNDLLEHNCLVMRSSGGTLLDRWLFERAGEQRTIDVKSRLLSYHSMWVQAAACAGAGVIRVADFSVRSQIASGQLKPTLLDWQAQEAPLHFVVYRPQQRRSRLVRAFVDFLVEIFDEMERKESLNRGAIRAVRPEWYGRIQGRQSAHRTKRPQRGAR